MRRSLLAVVVTLVVVIPAQPVFAHTRASVASNWKSEITHDPGVPGVTWRVYPAGEYLEITNDGTSPITILGYEGEPYLRISEEGTYRNLNSPATYLNEARDGDVTLPPRADAAAAPEWERVSDSATHSWFDHRVHRMPNDERGSLTTWRVPFELDGEADALEGSLRQNDAQSWWLWLTGAALLIGVALLVGARRGDERRVLAALVLLVALLNLIHIPDEVVALPAGAIDIAYGVFHNALFIGIGVLASWLLLSRRSDSFVVLWVGSAGVAFHQGFLQVQQLGKSTLATIWPPGAVRLLVALSIVQFLWVSVAALRARDTSPEGEVLPERAATLRAVTR